MRKGINELLDFLWWLLAGSAFINGYYVYLTDDATGSLRVIDFMTSLGIVKVGDPIDKGSTTAPGQ